MHEIDNVGDIAVSIAGKLDADNRSHPEDMAGDMARNKSVNNC